MNEYMNDFILLHKFICNYHKKEHRHFAYIHLQHLVKGSNKTAKLMKVAPIIQEKS